MSNRQIWTSSEEEFLKKNFESMTNKELARALSKSIRSIEHKVVRMNLKKRTVQNYNGDIENETWRKIKNSVYSISQFGRCRNDSTNRLMILRKDRYGYLKVKLVIEGKQKDFTIHKLVAEYFLPKIPGKTFINHKDGIKSHSYLSNLEWCTPQENTLHAHRMGLCHYVKGIDVYGAKFKDDVIIQICELGLQGLKAKDIKSKLNLDINTNYINAILRGESRKDITQKYLAQRSTTIPKGSRI